MAPKKEVEKVPDKLTDAEKKKKKQANKAKAAGTSIAELTAANDAKKAGKKKFALQVMPFGGLYISGGVTAHLQSFLRKDPNFLEAYHDKGRVSPMLQDIPLFFVKGDEMGQRGAHLRAVNLLHHHREGLGLPRTEGRNVHLAPPRDASVGNFLKKINAEVGGFFTKTVSDMISSGARPPYDRSEPYSLPALGPYGKHGEYDISGSLACFVLALIGLQRVRINTLRSRVTFQPQVLRLQEPLRHV